MTTLFQKLNFKNHATIISMNTPDSFKPELEGMSDFAVIIEDPALTEAIEYILVFVKTAEEIQDSIEKIVTKLRGDAIVWYCYPKGTSKKYKCYFNRDNGWSCVKKYELETVRQVAIDEDWSALRFRKVEFIKTVTRK
jgi:hypothetical protein